MIHRIFNVLWFAGIYLFIVYFTEFTTFESAMLALTVVIFSIVVDIEAEVTEP